MLPLKLYIENIAESKRREALAKSNVKIRGNDVVASWKTLACCALSPVYFAITNLIFYIWYSQRFAGEGFLMRCLVTWVFSVLGFIYLAVIVPLSDKLLFHLRVCSVRLFVVFYKRKVQHLKRMRENLVVQVYLLSDKYGKMFIDKFEKRRLFKLKRRKSLNLIDESFVREHMISVDSPSGGKKMDSSYSSRLKDSGISMEKNDYQFAKKTM